MRILVFTLSLTTAASFARANPVTNPNPNSPSIVQSHGNPHTTTTTMPKPTTPTTTTSSTGRTTTPAGGTASTGSTTTTKLNPIAAKITSHSQLDSKVTAMLPKGMTLNQASMGFKNQGQFIAALHVSQNLGISFKDVRTQMVKNNLSLGQAIQKVKGTSDITAATTAQKQADDDIRTATTTTKKTGGQ